MSCSRSGLRCRGRFRSGGTIRLWMLVLCLRVCRNRGLERTRNQYIPVMRHEILDYAVRAVLDIDVAPVYPAVLGLHSG